MSKRFPPYNYARVLMGEGEFDRMKIDSQLLKSHLRPLNPDADFISIPLCPSTITRHTSVAQFLELEQQGGYAYRTLGNLTVDNAEVMIREVEQGAGTVLFCGGLSAISSIFFTFLKAGDHVICQDPCYSGTYSFVKKIISKFGVQVDWVESGAPISEFKRLIKANTKLVYVETPSNPDLAIADLEAIGRLRKNNPDILTAVDGTFASPILQKPLQYGIDFSVHSCSKYMGGHTDLVAGVVTTRTTQQWRDLKWYQGNNVSNALSPFEAYLLIRGLKTLPLRMERHSSNGMEVAKFLEDHDSVKKVWYPGLRSHPQHDIAKKQMSSFSGMISFELPSLEAAKRCVENVRLINLAVSLGGAESLIEHPATMTHGAGMMGENAGKNVKIPAGLVRLSVGLEHSDDLKADMKRALDNI